MTIFQRPVTEPIRELHTVIDRYAGPDRGLIFSWEQRRLMHDKHHEASAAAIRGELPPLVWRGGLDDELVEKSNKYGSFLYLAQLQGLRNEELVIDTESTIRLQCSKFNTFVTFNNDGKKPPSNRRTDKRLPLSET